ncbi:MAG TPA: DUF3488 and transglutaminase-like domain-containing protein [Planctomycetaceae bacterium]|nr:DUF3488 and transglutaminase-like domain-containing protein [Planctomycetaceae bacterium]
MQLTKWYQASLCATAALAGFMLAIAEGKIAPQILTPLLAVVAFVGTDRRGALVLPPLWANACGFLALCLALAEFFGGGIEARLLAGAHLLVYASWIVLFQRKIPRLSWWLCALSLLQVAVGAVLMRTGLYGALVVLYFFLAVWTLSLFSLDQARERLQSPAGGDGEPRPDRVERRRGGGLRLAPAWAGEGSLALAAARLRAASQVQGTMQLDAHERWLRLRFAAGTFLWASLSLSVGLIFFLLTPRMWIGSGQPLGPEENLPGRSIAVSGFSDNVQLGQFGQILTSARPVFQVRILDEPSGETLDPFAYAARLGTDEPLFRGAVLSKYVPQSGRWENAGRFEWHLRVDEDLPRGEVRQEFRLEPIESSVLFAMHPIRGCRVFYARRAVTAFQDVRTGRLFASREHDRGARYDVYSPRDGASAGELYNGTQSRVHNVDRRATPELVELAALARTVAGYTNESTHPPPAEMARRLVAHLRDSDQYRYSLDTTAVDPDSDPIDDFVFRRRAGHCEYFASALTLMLRAVDVPARLVNGFKGGELSEGGILEVQRRHAHAWVEAYYDDRWHVLDPTPSAARLASVAEMGPGIRSLHDLVSALSDAWSKYVVNMSLAQQRSDFYEPLHKSVTELWESLQGDRQNAASLIASTRRFLSSPRRWISWQGGLLTFVLLLMLSGIVWLIRRAWRVARYLWARVRTATVDRERQVEFYERFRRLCERQGLVRAAPQTQREFAEFVSSRLRPVLAAAALEDLPERLVELFYRVRFGEQPLDRHSESQLDRRLSDLEQALAGARAMQQAP